ncbi:MAG TPA: hypothetical protein VJZ93_03065 [Candidatus Nanoarchaeia archaeon]|nr:hypothetical protein [Candidatus Nanoarchaeia archaeon]
MINERANKINEIVSRINTHPEYSSCVKREVFHAQREEAQKHSLDLELEGEGKKLTKNERVMILGRLDEAWKFLCERGMDIFSLAKLGAIIEPEPNKTGSFRNSQTKLVIFGQHSLQTFITKLNSWFIKRIIQTSLLWKERQIFIWDW